MTGGITVTRGLGTWQDQQARQFAARLQDGCAVAGTGRGGLVRFKRR